MKVRALAGVLAMLGGTASGRELLSRTTQGDVSGEVQLCEAREDATGVLREVRRLDVHIPGKNFFLRPTETGTFDMLGLPVGTHALNVEDPDGMVLATQSVNVRRRSVTQVDIPVCPDRDVDLVDQSEDCDDRNPDVAGALEWFTDGDGDGFGDPSLPSTLACVAPPGSVREGTGCLDGSANVHSGQTTFFATQRGDGSFEYNCDGVEQRGVETQGRCASTGFGFCVHRPGWVGTTVPPIPDQRGLTCGGLARNSLSSQPLAHGVRVHTSTSCCPEVRSLGSVDAGQTDHRHSARTARRAGAETGHRDLSGRLDADRRGRHRPWRLAPAC